MKPAYIVGGVAIAGGAVWYLTRKPAAPPVVPVTPGVTSGVSTFNKICRPIASAGLQAGAASQGAPPTATAGIASQAASVLCDLDSAVIKYAGKGIVYAGKAVATVAVDVAKGAAFLGKGVATGAVDTAKAVATGAVAVEHVAVAVAKAPIAVVTTAATAGKAVVSAVGSVGSTIAGAFSTSREEQLAQAAKLDAHFHCPAGSHAFLGVGKGQPATCRDAAGRIVA